MSEETASMQKLYNEDPKVLKTQITNLKSDIKSLQSELKQTQSKASDSVHKYDGAESRIALLSAELEKYKHGIKDFKDIVTLCEKEDKESKQTMSKYTPKNAKSKRDTSENK